MALGLGGFQEVLELGSGDDNSGCTRGVVKDAVLTGVATHFWDASGDWSGLKVLGFPRAVSTGIFGILMIGTFWGGVLGTCREEDLLGGFLISGDKGGGQRRCDLQAGSSEEGLVVTSKGNFFKSAWERMGVIF